jgi:hypothetical protein
LDYISDDKLVFKANLFFNADTLCLGLSIRSVLGHIVSDETFMAFVSLSREDVF